MPQTKPIIAALSSLSDGQSNDAVVEVQSGVVPVNAPGDTKLLTLLGARMQLIRADPERFCDGVPGYAEYGFLSAKSIPLTEDCTLEFFECPFLKRARRFVARP
ncbi:hypothetical protein GGS23DRAFT_592986 [Durotheca rogersii]|uniref:uncharacterized protein n=1 Tax=Durotheca rogersii TaxID=419775 RepID=UPI00221F5A6B|nr:uncharacterized protein GGS23DRAFT_592986 [Durotheca rogersii]KAI5867701.1 hypothetical protein GGS23DRAFT_592986 [Durotheca rogersii]